MCSTYCRQANVIDVETKEICFQLRLRSTVFIDTLDSPSVGANEPLGNNALILVNTILEPSNQVSKEHKLTKNDTIRQLVSVSHCEFRTVCHRDVIQIITTQGHFTPVPQRKVFTMDIAKSQEDRGFAPNGRSGSRPIKLHVSISNTKFLNWDCSDEYYYNTGTTSSRKPNFVSLTCHFSPLLSARTCQDTLALISDCVFHNSPEVERQMIVVQGFQMKFTDRNRFR